MIIILCPVTFLIFITEQVNSFILQIVCSTWLVFFSVYTAIFWLFEEKHNKHRTRFWNLDLISLFFNLILEFTLYEQYCMCIWFYRQQLANCDRKSLLFMTFMMAFIHDSCYYVGQKKCRSRFPEHVLSVSKKAIIIFFIVCI